jgi:hypothetical protein
MHADSANVRTPSPRDSLQGGQDRPRSVARLGFLADTRSRTGPENRVEDDRRLVRRDACAGVRIQPNVSQSIACGAAKNGRYKAGVVTPQGPGCDTLFRPQTPVRTRLNVRVAKAKRIPSFFSRLGV